MMETAIAAKRPFRGGSNELDRLFTSGGARNYDRDAQASPMRYHIAHAIQNEFAIGYFSSKRSGSRLVVDLGCGTANDGVDLLSASKTITYLGIDSSTDMLSVARCKMKSRGLSSRSAFECADFTTMDIEMCRELTGSLCDHVSPGCIISALALHHYTLPEKRSMFGVCQVALEEGGLFVVTDLFASESAICSKFCIEAELWDIRLARQAQPLSIDSKSSTFTEHHYVRENKPSILSAEIDALRDAGFSSVDVLYRHGQLAVLVAMKGLAP